MERIAHQCDIYQAGTLSGNPIAMAAGIATLRILKQKKYVYRELERKSKALFEGIFEVATEKGISIRVNRIGSMGSLFFTEEEVIDFDSAKRSNKEQFKRFYKGMLSRGVYLAPSPFEAIFISLAHTDEVIEYTIDAIRHAFEKL